MFFIYNIEGFYLQYRMADCYICSQCLDDTKERYNVLPCNHEFHAGCLIDWFRIRSTTECPCCVNMGNYYNEFLNFLDDFHLDQENQLLVAPMDFAHASRCARKRDAPKPLKRLYARYKDFFFKRKQNSSDIKMFRLEHGDEFRLLSKKIRGLRRKRRILNRNIKRVKKSLLVAFHGGL